MEIIHQAIPLEICASLLHVCRAEFATYKLAAENGSDSPAVQAFAKQSGFQLSIIAEEMAALKRVLDPLIEKRFPGIRVSWRNSSARTQSPQEAYKALRWHQDYVAMEMRYRLLQGVTAWIPLEPIDGTRPSLEIADSDTKTLRQHEADALGFQVLPEEPKGGKIIEKMEVGDVLLFAPYIRHRTYINQTMTQPRISLDVRYREGWPVNPGEDEL